MHSKKPKQVSSKNLPGEMRKNLNLQQSPSFTSSFCAPTTNDSAFFRLRLLTVLGVARPGEANGVGSKGIGSSLALLVNFSSSGLLETKKKTLVVGGTYLNEVRRSYFFLRNRFLQGLGSKNFPQKSLEWNLTQFQWRWTVALERSQKSGEGTFCLVESLIVTLWNTNTT